MTDKKHIEELKRDLAIALNERDSYHDELTRLTLSEPEQLSDEAQDIDTRRLNFIQAMTKGYGRGWIFRESNSNRGMRLHETGLGSAHRSVRDAIDVALNAWRKASQQRN